MVSFNDTVANVKHFMLTVERLLQNKNFAAWRRLNVNPNTMDAINNMRDALAELGGNAHIVDVENAATTNGDHLVVVMPFNFQMPVGVGVDDYHTAIENIKNILNDVGIAVLERLIQHETGQDIKITYSS